MNKNILFLIFIFFTGALYSQDWLEVANTPFNYHHPLGFGFNGKGYVLTGSNDYEFESKAFWEYNPDTDTWRRLDDYPGPARSIAIGDDWDGKYYFGFGNGAGYGAVLKDLWVFDPDDMSFTELPSCPCEGRSHPAFVAHNDKIYMGSGSGANSDLEDWWVYDIPSQVWTQKTDIPGGRRHHPFQFHIGNDIYVGGGHKDNWSKYNPEEETWTQIDDYPKGRVAGTQFSYKEKGYVLSGHTGQHNSLNNKELFMEYDADLDTWNEIEPHPNGSRWAPGHFIIENDLYLFGGYQDTDQENVSMWKYQFESTPMTNIEKVVSNSTQLDVYPNPFVNEVNIKLELDPKELSHLEIYNVLGELVYSKPEVDENMDLSFLRLGTYSLVLKKLDGTLFQRTMVKQ